MYTAKFIGIPQSSAYRPKVYLCNSKCYNKREFRTKKHASFTTDEKQQSFSQIH